MIGETSGRDPRPETERAGEPGRRGIMQPLIVATIIIAGLYFGRPVLEPLALALLLSLLLAPAVRWLHLHRVGRSVSVFATVILAVVVIVGVAGAVGDELVGLARDLPRYEENIAAKIRSFNTVPGAGVVGRATRVLRDLGNQLSPAEASGPLASAPGEARQPVPVEIRSTEPALLQVLRNVAGPLLQPVAFIGLVLLFAILILLKREDLRDRMLQEAVVAAADPRSGASIAVRCNQSLAYLLRDSSRARRIFVSHQQQSERDKRWIAVIASMANLFVIEAAIVLGARMP